MYAAHALPFEIFLLAVLLEEYKEVMRLGRQVGEMFDYVLDTNNLTKS